MSKLLDAIRVCDYADIHQLKNMIQSEFSIEGIRDTVDHLLKQNGPPQSVLSPEEGTLSQDWQSTTDEICSGFLGQDDFSRMSGCILGFRIVLDSSQLLF